MWVEVLPIRVLGNAAARKLRTQGENCRESCYTDFFYSSPYFILDSVPSLVDDLYLGVTAALVVQPEMNDAQTSFHVIRDGSLSTLVCFSKQND